MNPLVNALAIAARIRALLHGSALHSIEEAAPALGISERELASSVDDSSPSPTTDVLVAVVERYGVDPTWLVTGQYDVGAHRQAMASSVADLRLLLHRLLSGRVTPTGSAAIGDPQDRSDAG